MSSIDPRRVILLFVAFPALFCLAKSGEWWEKKPVAQWSNEQVYEFLNASPWVSESQGYFQQGAWMSENKTRTAPIIMVYYQARILTAKPVREAFLQWTALNPKVVTAKSLKTATAAEELRNRMQELLQSCPDDLLVKGDEKHLIFAVSKKIRTVGISGDRSELEVFSSDELSDVDQSTIVVVTSLTTNTGKRVELANYQPPGIKQTGAMYYFPKNLPDGTPLVTAGDRELLFETVINKKKVKFKFDPGKMICKGKLEI